MITEALRVGGEQDVIVEARRPLAGLRLIRPLKLLRPKGIHKESL
jgi:hypothetical protein